VNSGTFPRSIAIDPDGRYLYVTNLSSPNVSSFAINITTGALNGLGWVGAVYGPSSVAVDPDGKFAYVVQLANIVASYAIDPATGALTNLGMTVATGSNPFQIALTR
jgi:6-phosphogluconolactonase (cycloisomerase 2 family)